MRNGCADLKARLAELDASLKVNPAAENVLFHINQFIACLERVVEPDPRGPASVVPAHADALQQESLFLRKLAIQVPEIVDGPIALDAQYWISTGKPYRTSADRWRPEESMFTDIRRARLTKPTTKPAMVGFFTSTGVLESEGMWQTYLDRHKESTLHPPPWFIWKVTPERNCAIFEVNSARQWVSLVASCPEYHQGLVYPNWKAVAQLFDGIHITIRAVAAIQGLYLQAGAGTIAPSYWDVECTVWLRWRFNSTTLVAVMDGGATGRVGW